MPRRSVKKVVNLAMRDVVIDSFHRYWYESADSWQKNSFLGFGIKQCPFDLQTYQELLFRIKPAFIVQTGVSEGGSAMYFATLLDAIATPGSVFVGVDIELTAEAKRLRNPRIHLIEGDSTSEETLAQVSALLPAGTGFVSLDSDHAEKHVRKEMELYPRFVGLGSYMVVEDTNVNGHPVAPGHGPGPFEAVEDFLRTRSDFARDDVTWRRNLMSFHQSGWLQRVR